MAGLFGIVRSHSSEAELELATELRLAAAAMLHSDSLDHSLFMHRPDCGLGAVFHRRDPAAVDHARSGRFTVLMYGQVRRTERGTSRLDAEGLSALLQRCGIGCLDDLSGSYQLAVVDNEERRLIVQNDRQATLPMYFSHGPDWFAFGPEAKCMFAAGTLLEPEIDPTAAACFLREGFLLPAQSIFKQVSRMRPGQRVSVDLASGRAETGTYWQLKFEVDRSLTRTAAVNELHALLLRAHSDVVAEAGSAGYGMFLTGGLDSRGMVACLDALNSRPDMALTWAGPKWDRSSDPEVAAKIATHYGIRHEVHVLNPAEVASNAGEWLRVSELANEIMGFMMAPVGVFHDCIPPDTRFMLVGDQLFGHGFAHDSFADCVRVVLKSAFRDATAWTRGCLHEDFAAASDQALLRDVAGSSRSRKHGRNVIDELTYTVHRPSWSFSAGNSRDTGVPVRRPLMTDQIVSLMARLPQSWRNDKGLYHLMLRKKFPGVLKLPFSNGAGPFDWHQEFANRKATQELLKYSIQDVLLESEVGHQLLHRDQVRLLVQTFFDAGGKAGERQSMLDVNLVNLRRQLSRVPYLAGGLKRLSTAVTTGRASSCLPPLSVIRRLSMIGLLVGQVDGGGFSAEK